MMEVSPVVELSLNSIVGITTPGTLKCEENLVIETW